MICLVGSMAAGGIVPALLPESCREFFDNKTGLAGNFVPPMIMLMLLFAFIDVKFSRESVGWSHLRILLFLAGFSAVAYYATFAITGNSDFALIAFLLGISPTANAAPVITSLLNRREDYVTLSVVATNLFVAVALAPLATLVVGGSIHIETAAMAWKTMLLIGTPFVTALIFRNFIPRAAAFVRRWKIFSFYLWMLMLFTVCAQSSAYILKQDLPSTLLLEIFALTLVMCALNFVGGFCLGEPKFRRECSQSVGQKNTMLMLWVGLTFFSPVIALGATFYVICHNSWNSWQLRHADKNATTIR